MGDCARYFRDAAPVEAWLLLYRELEASGRLAQAFPLSDTFSPGSFVRFVHDPDCCPWLLTFRGAVTGMIYLTDLQGTCARVHFAFAPAGRMRGECRLPAPVAIGRFAVSSILRDKDEQGQYIMDTLTGLTPAHNRAAVKLVTRYGGGGVLGVIPGACRVSGHERNVPGVMTYFTRENTCANWRDL